MRNADIETLALALLLVTASGCTRSREEAPVSAQPERDVPAAAAAAQTQCGVDRPGGCSGAWCSDLQEAVSARPCEFVAELAAAKCDLGHKLDACLKPGELRRIEFAARVGSHLAPLVREPVQCGGLEVVSSSCGEGLRLTYEFKSLTNDVLVAQSRLDSITLEPDSGVPEFSTVFCGACMQFGRLDGGWVPLDLSAEEAKRLLRMKSD